MAKDNGPLSFKCELDEIGEADRQCSTSSRGSAPFMGFAMATMSDTGESIFLASFENEPFS